MGARECRDQRACQSVGRAAAHAPGRPPPPPFSTLQVALHFLNAPIAALLGALVLGETFGARRSLGTLLCAAGATLVARAPGVQGGVAEPVWSTRKLGVLMGVCGAFFTAMHWLMLRTGR